MYEDIVKSIVSGRCLHVRRGVPGEWVKKTSVSGLQIAVALGTKQTEQENFKRLKIAEKKGGITEPA